MRGTRKPPSGGASTTRRTVVVLLTALALTALVGALARASGQRAGAWQPSVSPAGESEQSGKVPDNQAARALGGRKTLGFAIRRRAAAQAAAIPSAGGSWEYVGANNIGGRVTDVVVDPAHANTIYIAAAGGGVWKSSDAGLTYTPAWPNDYPQAIGSLARGSDGTLWAGTGEANASGGGITYRGDGVYGRPTAAPPGTNIGLANAAMIGRIAVDPTNPKRVLVAATGEIYSPAASAAFTARRTAARTGTASSRRTSRPRRGRARSTSRSTRPTRTGCTRSSGTTTATRPAALRRDRLGPVRQRQRDDAEGLERELGAHRQLARLRPAAELRRVGQRPGRRRRRSAGWAS